MGRTGLGGAGAIAVTDHPESAKPLRGSYFLHPGGMLHFHRRGQGEPVLLLHGCGSLGEEMLRAFSPWDGANFIAPDRPGYGFSTNFGGAPQGDLRAQAQTIARFLSWLDAGPCTVVAHSLGAAVALWLAGDHPNLVRNIVLLAPFCRPTREGWVPVLRLAVAPLVGGAIRSRAIPVLAPWIGRQIIRSVMRPRPVPQWLEQFPYRHASHPGALLTAAAELRSFNHSMRELERQPGIAQPAVAVFGSHDRTSPHAWHCNWLEARMHMIETIILPRTGHALHHAEPAAIAGIVKTLAEGCPPSMSLNMNRKSFTQWPGPDHMPARRKHRFRQ